MSIKRKSIIHNQYSGPDALFNIYKMNGGPFCFNLDNTLNKTFFPLLLVRCNVCPITPVSSPTNVRLFPTLIKSCPLSASRWHWYSVPHTCCCRYRKPNKQFLRSTRIIERNEKKTITLECILLDLVLFSSLTIAHQIKSLYPSNILLDIFTTIIVV